MDGLAMPRFYFELEQSGNGSVRVWASQQVASGFIYYVFFSYYYVKCETEKK